MLNENGRTKGFTLIELLVVVLIIGILASIALPQYRKAVDKAEATDAVIQGKALLNAQLMYWMANGSWNRDLTVFDIELSDKFQWRCADSSLDCTTTRALKSGISFGISKYTSNRYFLFCFARETNARANTACQSVGTYSHSAGSSRSKAYMVTYVDL